MPPKSKAKDSKLKNKNAPSQTVLFDHFIPSIGAANARAKKLVAPIPPPPRPQKPLPDLKGKGKAAMIDEELWVDKFAPSTPAELAVHKKKLEAVSTWLSEALHGGPTGRLRKYRRILALTGPAGSGKTSTLRVLAREMNFNILEWRNTADERLEDEDFDSLAHTFQVFLTRATALRPLFGNSVLRSSSAEANQVVLLEDLPNLSHSLSLQRFQAAILRYLEGPPGTPLVIIVSDSGTRGESKDESSWSKSDGIDIRTILPPAILNSAYVTQIVFNPIAATYMKPALNNMLDNLFASPTSGTRPSKDIIDHIIESSNGDIRSAIMTLQFASVVNMPPGQGKKSRKNAAEVLEAITKREQSLALFHLLGKVLYNKRVGDPPGAHLSKKENDKERRLDALAPKPLPLPDHLKEFTRRGSRVDPNVIYADSPIDTSLFSLYIHQNYPQFCNEAEEGWYIADALSLIDATNDHWGHRSQIAAQQFHTLTSQTLVALPSPVPRRNQKMFKPEFFEYFAKTREAEMGLVDVKAWLGRTGSLGWGKEDVELHLPVVLPHMGSRDILGRPPATHRSFSHLPYKPPKSHTTGATELNEHDEVESQALNVVSRSPPRVRGLQAPTLPPPDDFWRLEDDIEEF